MHQKRALYSVILVLLIVTCAIVFHFMRVPKFKLEENNKQVQSIIMKSFDSKESKSIIQRQEIRKVINKLNSIDFAKIPAVTSEETDFSLILNRGNNNLGTYINFGDSYIKIGNTYYKSEKEIIDYLSSLYKEIK